MGMSAPRPRRQANAPRQITADALGNGGLAQMTWTATISYRTLPDKETIQGPIIALAYFIRKNADDITSVELVPA